MSCQPYGSAAWDRGIVGPFLGPRRYVFGVFWRLGRARAKGEKASWNRSKALAAARGGARADKPRWVSNRVCCQAILGFQGVLDLSMAFMMLSSLCMQATITTLAGFPATLRR